MNKRFLLVNFLIFITVLGCSRVSFPITLEESFQESKASTQNSLLTISTGKISRTWELTPYGLRTTLILKEDEDYETLEHTFASDWNLPNILPASAQGKLISLTAKKSNDEGFTSDHLEVTAEFDYATEGIGLKYVIWAYPNATGLRTQIFLKKTDVNKVFKNDTLNTPTRAEYLPLYLQENPIKLMGYYNDTQHRNTAKAEILKEEDVKNGDYDWANIISVENIENGLLLVQESHKCVNQAGVNTGGYTIDKNGISASGIGINPEDITDEYQPLWAYWLVAYKNGTSRQQLALKQFDRARFPIDPKRDIYIMANNWGSGNTGDESKYASREENILEEIKTQKYLGIDLQQVDDGWQGHQYKKWDLVSSTKSKQYGEYDVYPNGWKNIKILANKENIRLGLWAAWNIPEEDLFKQYQLGGFTSYKLDFANLKNYETLHGFVNKVRRFIKKTDHKVRVNWDVTENPARIGYFFGREYGNIYLENRKPFFPKNVVYRPYLVLRDAWQVSKYTNLNKFQISIQNIDKVDKNVSDAYLHNYPYTVALALMGSPIFFQETHYYSQEARDQIKNALSVYKKHRNKMYEGYVFPIGEKPDNASWSGFQNYHPDTNLGYILAYREIENKETSKGFKLHFLKNVTLKLTNLLTNTTETKTVDAYGNITLDIETPADFRFFKYEIQ